jgi:flagellar basal-body rod protein FlgB
VFLFDLASQHGQWLAARQAAAASNVANADTPGYKARDVVPFEAVLDRTALDMTVTRPGHLQLSAASAGPVEMEREQAWDVTHSGNDVTMEAELMKIGANGRMQSLDTNLTRMFQRMILTSLKV